MFLIFWYSDTDSLQKKWQTIVARGLNHHQDFLNLLNDHYIQSSLLDTEALNSLYTYSMEKYKINESDVSETQGRIMDCFIKAFPQKVYHRLPNNGVANAIEPHKAIHIINPNTNKPYPIRSDRPFNRVFAWTTETKKNHIHLQLTHYIE